MTFANDFAFHWQLDPNVVFLNHGSFGACPSAVLSAQESFRKQLELEPVRFFGWEYEPHLDQSREALASFIGTDPTDLVFVPNATTGVNSVLRSLYFEPGDELLTTSHGYNACRNALDFVAQRWGAKVVVAPIPFPLESGEQILKSILDCTSDRTKLALLDHITSQSALIFPIQALVERLTEQGIDTLVDGAHAPGMVPLNLKEIGATYYTGNCHKWMCAPKGSGFLVVRRDRQDQIRPLTISHGANSPRTDRSRFQLEFDWTGTNDPTPFLSIAEAIRVMKSISGGWQALMANNRALALQARKILCEALGQPIPCPEALVGAIATIPLPTHFGKPNVLSSGIDVLQEWLWKKHNIEVPIIPWNNPPQKLIRVSAQLYNSMDQYRFLADVLTQAPNF